ncbi:MAG: O-antigen ligase family protein [Micromonosporaceae bacterium]
MSEHPETPPSKHPTDTSTRPRRPPRLVLVGGAVSAAVALAVGIQWSSAPAAVAVLLAAVVLWVALSLPGITPQGLFLGVGVPLVAMMAWTKPYHPIGIWVVTATVTVAAALWMCPWWRSSREALRLGGFWLPVGLWLIGALGALLLGRVAVAGGRIAYGGFALVVALLVFQTVRRGRDISIGIAAGLMVCNAALLAAGAPWVFTTGTRAATGQEAWARAQTDRFWGGPWLMDHPNLIAMMALLVAIRVGMDARFRPWQRFTAVGNGVLLIYITDSRTALIMAGVASVTYGLLHLGRAQRRAGWRPRVWRALGHALLPVTIILVVFAATGGADNLVKDRYQNGRDGGHEVSRSLSGRVEIWDLILDDFRSDTAVEQALGNTDSIRGDILRHQDPSHPRYDTQAHLGPHNGLVAALRRGGVVGLVLIVGALGLVAWRTVRRADPCWIPALAVSASASLISQDALVILSPVWLMVFAAELWTRYGLTDTGPAQPPKNGCHRRPRWVAHKAPARLAAAAIRPASSGRSGTANDL